MKIQFRQKLFLSFLGVIALTILPLIFFLNIHLKSWVLTSASQSIAFSDTHTLLTQAQQILLIGTLASILIALFLSFNTARRFAYPVDVMTRIARKMAKRDFREKIKIETHDEHAVLARSLNEMSDELERHIGALSKANTELEATLSSMTEGLLVVDEHARIVHLNKAARTMFDVTENPVGMSELELLRHVPLHDILASVIRSGRHTSTELTLAGPPSLVLQANIAPIAQAGGGSGAVAVFHNVTQLRKLENMRRDFVANISHELKTPLTSIKGFSETLLDPEETDKDTVKKNIEIIHRQAKQLETLIADLLELAAIESGEIQMKKAPIAVETLFKGMLDEYNRPIKEKNLRTEMHVSPAALKVKADEKWLRRALFNLLTNACAYTDQGGSITLSAHADEEGISLEVKDTGIGIAPRDLPRIFERFYRVDKARSRASGGTGLGLSIVKHIAEAHGGRVEITSVLGKGSLFAIHLPL